MFRLGKKNSLDLLLLQYLYKLRLFFHDTDLAHFLQPNPSVTASLFLILFIIEEPLYSSKNFTSRVAEEPELGMIVIS